MNQVETNASELLLKRRDGLKCHQNQGWINYYGRFHKSAMYPTLRHINRKLCLWATKKYKKLKHRRRHAEYRLGCIAKIYPGMFPQWKMGVRPTVG